MRVKELKVRFEDFRQELQEHFGLWRTSLDQPLPDYPVRNIAELTRQTDSLARKLGTLRSYIRRFVGSTILHLPATGTQWDAYDSAVSNDVCQRKGPSIENVLPQLQQILGRLDALNDEDEVPEDPLQPIRSAAPVDHGTHHARIAQQAAGNDVGLRTAYAKLEKRYERLKSSYLGASALIVGAVIVVGCEYAARHYQWQWLMNHPNSLSIRLFSYFTLLSLLLGLFLHQIRRDWLKYWLPSVLIPLVIALIQAISAR